MQTFKVAGLDQELRVVRFEGSEGISELFAFDITLASDDKSIAFDDVIGRKAVLMFRTGEEARYVHGIVSDFEQGDEGKKLTTYRATLVPDAWRLRHRRASRIFQGDTVRQILEKVLAKAGILASDCRFALRADYGPREYCVQYRESDWAFLSRLMEEEGIQYFFDSSENKSTLVFADNPSVHAPLPGGEKILFRPDTGALRAGEHISRFRYAERVRTGKVTLREYNWKKPTLPLERSTDAPHALEAADYPGDYEEPGVGSRLANVRLEQLQTVRQTGDGESACARLAPGFAFALADHPRDDFNKRWVVTRVEHRGFDPHLETGVTGDASYENRFEVLPATVPFRPAQLTPWPSIRGVQTAIVVGPKGEEIYTDEHGRVKVRFHWDREGKGDESSSCWIRVSQVWAGPAWGALYLPRVGHEVVVDFIEGDPDRPLITGSVYHGTNVPPYPLPGDRTRSTLKSQSIGGGGSNELRFEDKKGSEEVYLHAQKDWNSAVEHDQTLQVGHSRAKTVTADDTEKVGGSKTILVGQNQTETIGANDTLTVGANLLVAVGGAIAISSGGGGGGGGGGGSQDNDVSGVFEGSVKLEIKKTMALTVDQDRTDATGGSSTESVSKDKTALVDGAYSLSIGKGATVTVGASQHSEVKEKKTLVVGEKLTLECGDSLITIEKNGKITVQGKDITVKGEGDIKIEGKKIQVKSEGAVNVEASGDVKVKGGNVIMN